MKNTSKRFLIFVFAFLILASQMASAAVNYDIKHMTPAIQAAIQNRQGRYGQLQSMKAAGQLGEDNQGFVQALDPTRDAKQIASSENQDRQVIYLAIVEQNQLGAEGLAKVKIAFAEVQRERAARGEMIQLPSGEWVKK